MDLPDFEVALNQYTASREFVDLDSEEERQRHIAGIRHNYLLDNPDTNVAHLNDIVETANMDYLRRSGNGRIVPTTFLKENNIIFPNQKPEWDRLSTEGKNKELESFRSQIVKIADQNPTQREDTIFYLNQVSEGIERIANSEKRNKVSDFGVRAAEGYMSMLADFVGATEVSKEIKQYFHEDVSRDEDISSSLAQGVGSAGASIALMAGAAIATRAGGGGKVAAGAAGYLASLIGNGIYRYNEAYENAVKAGVNSDLASEAGISALPAAVIDVMSDKIIASKAMPKGINKVLKIGTEAEKKAMINQLLSDNSLRGKLLEYSKTSISEGLSEAAGDAAAAYGPYVVTGEDDYLPSAQDSLKSFYIGAMVGGGMTSAMDVISGEPFNRKGVTPQMNEKGEMVVPTYATASAKRIAETAVNIAQTGPEKLATQSKVYDLLSEGQYKQAYELSKQLLEQPDTTPDQEIPSEPILAGPKIKDQAAGFTTSRGSVYTVNEDDTTTRSSIANSAIPKEERITHPASDSTVYVSPENAEKIKDSTTILPIPTDHPDGTVSFDKAKIATQPEAVETTEDTGEENQTTPTAQEEEIDISMTPQAGMRPVQMKDGKIVHVGTPITNVFPATELNEFTNTLPEADRNAARVKLNSLVEGDIPLYQYISNAIKNGARLRAYPDGGMSLVIKTAKGEPQERHIAEEIGQAGIDYAQYLYNNKKKPVTALVSKALTAQEEAEEAVNNALKEVKVEDSDPEVTNQINKASPKRTADTIGDIVKKSKTKPVSATEYITGLRKHFKNKKSHATMLADIAKKNPGLQVQIVAGIPANAFDRRNNIIYLIEGDQPRSTIVHEVCHGLVDADIDTYIKYDFNADNAKTYKQTLEEAVLDNAIPEHIRVLIESYLQSAKKLKMEQWIGNTSYLSDAEDVRPSVEKGEYAFTNLNEFAAETLANEVLQKKLAGIIYKGKSLWENIVTALAKVYQWLGENGQEYQTLSSKGVNTYQSTLYAIRKMMESDIRRGRKNNINEDMRLLPSDPRSKMLETGFKRLSIIARGKLSDRTGAVTQKMMSILHGFHPSDIIQLKEEHQTLFFKLIDNIYSARQSAIMNPKMRWDSDTVIAQLEAFKKLVDATSIRKILEDYEGVIYFAGEGIDITDRDALMKAVNAYAKEHVTEDVALKMERSEKNQKKLQRMYDNWRKEYVKIVSAVIGRFGNVDNYIEEIERINGRKIKVDEVKEMLKAHFNYLTTLDISKLESKELYYHFFAINNLVDGHYYGIGTLTAKHLATQRNINEDVSQLEGKMRDPVKNSSKMINTLDNINRLTELYQVELQRSSRFKEVNEWIQSKFFGPLLDAVMRTSFNMQVEVLDQYIAARDRIFGHDLTTEDRVSMSIAGRLVQSEAGTDRDAALLRNIKKERQSIVNKINRDPANRKLFTDRILPVFEEMVKGLEEYGDGAMDHLLDSLETRIAGKEGLDNAKKRIELLETVQDIFDEFSLASEILSEGFFHQPFKRQVLYVSNDVMSTNTAVKDEWSSIEPITELDGQMKKQGVKSKPGFLMDRGTDLGPQDFYSYNIEHTLSRNINRIAVEQATLGERFVNHHRLSSSSDLHNIISIDENGVSKPERLSFFEEMTVKLVRRATTRGVPMDEFTSLLQTLTGMYARPKLSSVHHIITQPLAALVDYSTRTGDGAGWLAAAAFYAGNFDRVNDWFKKNHKWTWNRMAIESESLDISRTPSSDDIEQLKNHPFVKSLNKIYDGLGNAITFFMNRGDNFAAKITILAEFQRQLNKKYPNSSIDDLLTIGEGEGQMLSQSVLNAERNINTSNKILRGDLWSNRNTTYTNLRNLLFAFSSHSGSLASQVQQAIRDIRENKALGGDLKSMEPQLRVIAAVALQQVAFTSSRFIIGAMMTNMMIGFLRDLFDNKDKKLEELQLNVYKARRGGNKTKVAEAEYELALAKNLTKVITKIEQSTQSSDSWFKQVIRDGSGAFHLFLNSGIAMQAIGVVVDPIGGKFFREANDAIVEDYKDRIKIAKERGNINEAAKLSADMMVADAAEYVPLAYPINGGFGIGGLYGSVADSYFRAARETMSAIVGEGEYSFNDLVLQAACAGIGQSEFDKILNYIDQVEDANFKSQMTQEKKIEELESAKLKPKAK